ncbi:MAG: hypothetical protein ACLRVT_03920 [Oscillospiraceae bacterium]
MGAMKEKIRSWKESLKENPQRKIRVLVVLGMIGILLILLSECRGPQKKEQTASSSDSVSQPQYAQQLQEQLKGMLEKVDGVGKVNVMVTLENNGETVYVKEEKKSTDTQRSADAGSGETIQQSQQQEDSYIFVDAADGSRTALVQKQLQPSVKGVVIVCDGAGISRCSSG